MKKIIFTTLLALTAGIAVQAQNMYDGLFFSENDYVGSARTLAMGNAFTALGGDTGAMGLNPAGTAIIKNIQASFSVGFNTAISGAQGTMPEQWFGDYTSRRTTNASIPNIGIAYSVDTHRSSGVKRVTLGFASNVSKVFLDNTRVSGNTYGTSYAGWLAANTDAPYTALVKSDAYDIGMYPWDCIAGVQGGLISNIGGEDRLYVGATEKYTISPDGTYNIYAAGTLRQDYGRSLEGAKKDGVINLGLNINDWIFLGANFGITAIRYEMGWHIEEEAQDMKDFDIVFNDKGEEVLTYFKSLRYQYRFNVKGSGMYGKFGIIMTPTKSLRIGATVQTPTYQTMTESWNVAATSSYDNSKYNSESGSPTAQQRYVLHTPWHAGAGVAYTIGKKALVSADYEATFFKSMKFGYMNEEDRFGAVNESIRDCMTVQHNLRLGAEYKVTPQFALRAGYDMHTTAVVNDYDIFGNLMEIKPQYRHAASAGIGFQTKGALFFDLAAKASFLEEEYIKPYADYILDTNNGKVLESSPEIRNVRTLINGVFTIGYRF